MIGSTISSPTSSSIGVTNCAPQLYGVYGLRVRSSAPLTLPLLPCDGSADVEILAGEDTVFDREIQRLTFDPTDWIHICSLPEGGHYFRLDEMFDFLVSPAGDRIFYRLLSSNSISIESFQTYALGRVFSLALVKMGYEPLHAATVVVDGKAVAFLGSNAFGKSSLAACFVSAKYPLLTDDVLRLQDEGDRFLAFPGPPRLKLFPKAARRFLGDAVTGTSMNQKAMKLVYPLTLSQSATEPVSLRAIYVLKAPRKVHRKQQIVVSSLSPLEAFINLHSYTHASRIGSERRSQQQFAAAQSLVAKVPIRALAYPRVFDSLPDVRDAVLNDLRNKGI